MPQILLLRQTGQLENLTVNYMVCLGAYRGLYLFNWAYRYAFEPAYTTHWLEWISGLVQTVLYGDFFYYYIMSRINGQPLVLPGAKAATLAA